MALTPMRPQPVPLGGYNGSTKTSAGGGYDTMQNNVRSVEHCARRLVVDGTSEVLRFPSAEAQAAWQATKFPDRDLAGGAIWFDSEASRAAWRASWEAYRAKERAERTAFEAQRAAEHLRRTKWTWANVADSTVVYYI